MRNLLAVAKHQHRQIVAALIPPSSLSPDREGARAQLRAAVTQLENSSAEVAVKLQVMEHDLLAYTPSGTKSSPG